MKKVEKATVFTIADFGRELTLFTTLHPRWSMNFDIKAALSASILRKLCPEFIASLKTRFLVQFPAHFGRVMSRKFNNNENTLCAIMELQFRDQTCMQRKDFLVKIRND